MKGMLIVVATITLMQGDLANRPAADVPAVSARLLGQFSGMERDGRRQVDLRIRFFSTASGGLPVAERAFSDVPLAGGQFSVALDPRGLAGSARYVEVGLRPAGRRYAEYQPAGQRRVLELEQGGVDAVWRLRLAGDDPDS
ncbi:MAG: hypothetical protein AAF358_00010 [Pseudomonadota bacterium]